jgi:hypothetical protein
MSKTQSKKKKRPSGEELAEMAMRGEDVTAFFGPGKMKSPMKDVEIMTPVQRVNVDFAIPMLNELDEVATNINVPRQSLIKIWLRDALDKHHQNKKYRRA